MTLLMQWLAKQVELLWFGISVPHMMRGSLHTHTLSSGFARLINSESFPSLHNGQYADNVMTLETLETLSDVILLQHHTAYHGVPSYWHGYISLIIR